MRPFFQKVDDEDVILVYNVLSFNKDRNLTFFDLYDVMSASFEKFDLQNSYIQNQRRIFFKMTYRSLLYYYFEFERRLEPKLRRQLLKVKVRLL